MNNSEKEKRLKELKEILYVRSLTKKEREEFHKLLEWSKREHLKICKEGNFPNSKTAKEYFE